ncbi:MAG: rod shape-determining protein [Tissierellia bacterium]|nr:rod shape-determining protein [Tissierellia bacterium]
MSIRKIIGIDLGTTNTRVYDPDKGVVLNMPTVVAVNPSQRRVVAVGEDAIKALKQNEEDLDIIFPLSQGTINDFNLAQALLEYIIEDYVKWKIIKPSVFLSIPCGLTDVEKRAYKQVTIASGAVDVKTIEQPLATAFGLGYDPLSKGGVLVVNIGGGAAEVAILSYGKLVRFDSTKIGGLFFNNQIIRSIKKDYNILLSSDTVENIKRDLLSATNSKSNEKLSVTGINLRTLLPEENSISGFDIFSYMRYEIDRIINMITNIIWQTPPELIPDIVENGIMLSGGGAIINNMSDRIKLATGIDVKISKEPLLDAISGIGIAIKNWDNYRINDSSKKEWVL